MRVVTVLVTVAVARKKLEPSENLATKYSKIFGQPGPCEGHFAGQNATCVPKGRFDVFYVRKLLKAKQQNAVYAMLQNSSITM